jgi:hypothetical protein
VTAFQLTSSQMQPVMFSRVRRNDPSGWDPVLGSIIGYISGPSDDMQNSVFVDPQLA